MLRPVFEHDQQNGVHPHVNALVRSLEPKWLAGVHVIDGALDLLLNEHEGVATGRTNGTSVGPEAGDGRVVRGKGAHGNDALLFVVHLHHRCVVLFHQVSMDGVDVVCLWHGLRAEDG